jgi:hypothetical protein
MIVSLWRSDFSMEDKAMVTTENRWSVQVVRLILGAAMMIAPVMALAQALHKSIVYVSPLPGSTDNSQESTIILGVSGTFDASVLPSPTDFDVVGSQSGELGGTIVLSDDARTLIFKPSRSFYPGERITVELHTSARTADGQAIGPLAFAFTVSTLSSLDHASILSSLNRSEFLADPLPTRTAAGTVHQLNKTAADTVPAGFPTPYVVTDDNPSPREIFLGTFRLGTTAGSVVVEPSNEQYLPYSMTRRSRCSTEKFPEASRPISRCRRTAT